MKDKLISIIAYAALSAAVVGLVIYSANTGNRLKHYREEEALAKEAVFEQLVASAEKLNTGLTKLCLSADSGRQAALLADLREDAENAADRIDQAMLGEESKRQLVGFVSTVGDYAHMLNEKLRKNGSIEDTDRDQLSEISSALEEVKKKLNYARTEGYQPDLELDGFFRESQMNPVQENLPRLTYDGPFSESILNRRPRGLAGYSVTEQKALKTAEDFAACPLKPAAHTDGDILPFYNFVSDDESLRVSVSKQGGQILSFRSEEETDGLSMLPTEDRIEAVGKTAQEWLEKHGYGTMRVGWKNYYGGTAVVEMIPETEEGVLLYPDLIKVRINMATDRVIGMDARNYLMNHVERDLSEPGLAQEEAEKKLSSALTVKERSLCLIPNDDGTEALCHGFLCEAEGDREVLVFLDAETGEERDILVVVRAGDGELTR